MVRVTYSLDEETVERIRRTAARLRKPPSMVVREAVADYAARSDRMSDAERLRLLEVLGRLRAAEPTRAVRAVDAEIKAVRHARRQGGRCHSS